MSMHSYGFDAFFWKKLPVCKILLLILCCVRPKLSGLCRNWVSRGGGGGIGGAGGKGLWFCHIFEDVVWLPRAPIAFEVNVCWRRLDVNCGAGNRAPSICWPPNRCWFNEDCSGCPGWILMFCWSMSLINWRLWDVDCWKPPLPIFPRRWLSQRRSTPVLRCGLVCGNTCWAPKFACWLPMLTSCLPLPNSPGLDCATSPGFNPGGPATWGGKTLWRFRWRSLAGWNPGGPTVSWFIEKRSFSNFRGGPCTCGTKLFLDRPAGTVCVTLLKEVCCCCCCVWDDENVEVREIVVVLRSGAANCCIFCTWWLFCGHVFDEKERRGGKASLCWPPEIVYDVLGSGKKWGLPARRL